jgi:hypothetical protein
MSLLAYIDGMPSSIFSAICLFFVASVESRDFYRVCTSVPTTAAQPMAILLHELVTNATKHGALSMPGGTVQLSWDLQTDGALRLERGGPPITAEPMRLGFGSRLMSLIVAERQLDGALRRQWLPMGLVLTLTLLPKHAQGTLGTIGLPWAETHRRISRSLPCRRCWWSRTMPCWRWSWSRPFRRSVTR